jgi:Cytochrome c3
MPATFDHDAQYFPIYSGAHEGEWSQCTDCHTNPANYAEFTCVSCHTNPETDEAHEDVGGYVYQDNACLACHPTGDADLVFDHNATAFPLTGAHVGVNCLDCHSAGFEGTSAACASCHTTDFNQAANPNHVALGLDTDCAGCHTTAAGWAPASFGVHNDYYPLNGAHAAVANDCAACHNGDYNNTPNTCVGCHLTDFNQTTDPDHEAAQFPTDCASCHSETAWSPSTFNHDNFYALTGGHAIIANDCAACHHGDYANTPTTCAGCHTTDFNQASNPNHVALGFSNDCASCHTTAVGWAPATFASHNDYYPLNGAHAAIANDCAACHNGDYNNTPNTCVGCHQADYNGTTDPNHAAAGFSTACASCHSEAAWTPADFDHDSQYFPIYSGAHEGEWNQCTDCHTNPNNYAEFTCVSCHTNPETDEDHEDVNGYVYNNTACLACHPTGDADLVFDHDATAFPLTGAHLGADCMQCHASGFAGTSTNCADCHSAAFMQANNPDHVALNYSTDCVSCHTTASGWAPASFDDHNDYYALNGAHAAIANDCAACHNGDYNNTPTTCVGCHLTDFNQTIDPDHEAAQFPTDCASCHTETAWSPSTFNHDDFYALTGGHALIANDCAACHNGDYNNTPNTCAGCHGTDFNQASNPNHVALGFSNDCASCHTTQPGWAPATFANHNDYYALNGAHAAIANDCVACHNGDYNNTPNTCVGCHLTDYNATTNPDHEAAQFPTDCQSCHTETAWLPASFDHDVFYVLNGAHAAIANDCAACHNGDYNNTPNTCVGCHLTDYNSTTNPDHEAAQFPTDCQDCHTESSWIPASFNHDDFYPLTGGHAIIVNECAACHNGDYNNTPNTCAGCHGTDFNQASNPNHVALGFSNDCASCHTTQPGWAPATFANHNDYYALNGAHAGIANDCAACHNGDYNNTPNTCVGCHLTDYNGTTNPDHEVAQFPTDCQDCHTETAWVPATFNHDNFYPLTGGHAIIANECAACHNGDYNNTPNTCAGCHTADFNQASNPNHVALGFSNDCASCHTTQPGWAPATFANHNDYYPLNGAHAAIANDCAACHNGNYSNTPNTCIGCHLTDFNQTTDPDHEAAQFSTNCISCHNENAWVPSSFDHNDFYPLVGAHAAIANTCVACHVGGNYSNTPNTCFGCHSGDYNGTNDPDHQSAGFPTNCEACHSQNAWTPATFNHDGMYFPIYSGTHDGEWDACVDCHTVPNNFSLFSCIDCHEHDNPAELADDHEDVNGYIYQSTACYACHPTGDD